jgi:hypothetical protein
MGPILIWSTKSFHVLLMIHNVKNNGIWSGHEGIAHTLGQMWCKKTLVGKFGANSPTTNSWPSIADAKFKTKNAFYMYQTQT